MKTTDEPVVVEQFFNCKIEVLWKAITEPNLMTQWFFEQITEFSAVEGFETQFEVALEERTFTHLWKILKVVPSKKIAYSWKYEEYPGDSKVIFELTEVGNGTALKLSTVVLEDFPDHVPEFTRESCLGGWKFFIQQRLPEFIKSLDQQGV